MKYVFLAPLALAFVPVSVLAQTVAPADANQAAQVPLAAPATNVAYLRTGTEVPLKIAEELTTKGKHLKVGQRVRMEVAEDVHVNGIVVIPVGTPAVGEITDVTNKGMWGKSGKLNGRALYATVNGRQIRLSGAFDDKGTAGGVAAVATSAIIFAPAGFFMTGTSAKIPVGAPVKGFVDEDVPLTIASSAPAPLVVGAPANDKALAINTAAAPQQQGAALNPQTH